MKIGIIGPAMSGKSTLFRLLTGATATTGKGGIPQGAAKIPDKRLETLSTVFRPQKTIFATVEFTDFPALGAGGEMSGELTSRLKTLDALAVVVRAHQDPAVPWPAEPTSPAAAFSAFLEEMILTDLVQVEKHLSRNKDKKRTPAETRLLERCRELLENMKPLAGASWREDELPILRNYAFLSLRPVLVAVNLDEAQLQEGSYPSEEEITKLCREAEYPLLTFCGTLEQEISRMAPEEQKEFMAAYGLKESGIARLASAAYKHLDLISFFTVGEDEVRAWTVKKNTPAKKAAGKVHSDMERGFIRAEVINFTEFVELGSSLKAAREQGKLRLEGKDYPVQDGDIITFRFNV
ncbi:MAG: redox-regulated ATPase YchF [Firmicutes bacterium]|jgi:GTP-binding protein YchF|nr:redox-regulated ATPase YchF [Bacillota bacterium]